MRKILRDSCHSLFFGGPDFLAPSHHWFLSSLARLRQDRRCLMRSFWFRGRANFNALATMKAMKKPAKKNDRAAHLRL